MEKVEFILVSVPGQDMKETTKVKREIGSTGMTTVHPFTLPDLRIGTLDALISLGDDLARIDVTLESICRRLVSLRESLDSDNMDFSVNNMNIDTYCVRFAWDEAKFPVKTPLRSLVTIMQNRAAKIDELGRGRQQEWNALASSLAAAERKKTGSLRDRDIDANLISMDDVVDTEYLTTALVVVPESHKKAFLSEYETYAQMVVPRSAKLVAQEKDELLYRVILFRRASDDFRCKCREQRLVVREFSGPIGGDKENRLLERDAAKQQKNLVRWTKANFAEAFTIWTHLKGIRLFVESVLRYGPPSRYETMILHPTAKKDHKEIHAALTVLYGNLTAASMLVNAEDEDDLPGESMTNLHAYVTLNMDVDLGLSAGAMF